MKKLQEQIVDSNVKFKLKKNNKKLLNFVFVFFFVRFHTSNSNSDFNFNQNL